MHKILICLLFAFTVQVMAGLCPVKDYAVYNLPCPAGFKEPPSVCDDWACDPLKCIQQTTNCSATTKCHRNGVDSYSCSKYVGSSCTLNSHCVANAQCTSNKCVCNNVVIPLSPLPGLGQACSIGQPCATGLICSVYKVAYGYPQQFTGTCLVPSNSPCKQTSDCFRSEYGRTIESCHNCICTSGPRCRPFEDIFTVKNLYRACINGWTQSEPEIPSQCAQLGITNCCQKASNECAYILEGLKDINFPNNNVVNEIKSCTSSYCDANKINQCVGTSCVLPSTTLTPFVLYP